MNIIYADDDQLSLEIVLRALQTKGHQVITINSSKVNDMLLQMQRLMTQGPVPEIVILDGHNVATDPDGRPLVDIQPTQLINWLQRQGLPPDTRFILYSSDDQLVEQAQSNQLAGFWAAVAKAGSKGGLNALLKAVENAPAGPVS